MHRIDRELLGSEGTLSQRLKGRNRHRRERLARLAQPGASPRLLRNDALPRLELLNIALDQLRLPGRKIRTLDPVHVREVAGTIGSLGLCDPILVGKNDVVIDGAIRVEAAKILGLGHVPCIRVDHLSDTEQRTLRLAINRLGEKGQWNFEALKIEFEELIIAEAPLEISGFDPDEIDQILLAEDPDAIEAGPLAPEPDAVAIARPGDVFLLGAHRIICGDATDPAILDRLIQGSRNGARLILTDEPYNVPIVGNVTSGKHREFAMASGEMSEKQFLGFNTRWMKTALPHLREGGVFSTFIDWRGYPIVHAAATKLGLHPLNLVVWTKTNAGMGSLYRSQHELLPLFKKGDDPHANNVALGKKGRWRSNVWTYPGASSLGSDSRRGLQEHPTVKPTAMLEDVLLDLSNRGDIVLDPFLGSGSTLIAAETTGRACRGVELDPLYIDVIIRRYERATDKSAVLEETGETFGSLAKTR